jgi:hypothetical protein
VKAAGLAAAVMAPLLLPGCGSGHGCGAVLANASGEVVEQVYLVPAGSPDWGTDLLGAGDLAPGATLPLRFAGQRAYGLRAVWASGRAVEAQTIEGCRSTRVILQDGGLRQE